MRLCSLLFAFSLGALSSATSPPEKCSTQAAVSEYDASEVIDEEHQKQCEFDDPGLLQASTALVRANRVSSDKLDDFESECRPVPPVPVSDKCFRGKLCCTNQAHTVGVEVSVGAGLVSAGASVSEGTGYKETTEDGMCVSAGARFASVCVSGPGASGGFSFGVVPVTMCGGFDSIAGLTRRRALSFFGIGVGEIHALTECPDDDGGFSAIIADSLTSESLVGQIKDQLLKMNVPSEKQDDQQSDTCQRRWQKVGEFSQGKFGPEFNFGDSEYCFTWQTEALESKNYENCEQLRSDCPDAEDLIATAIKEAEEVARKVEEDAKKLAEEIKKAAEKAAEDKKAIDRAAKKLADDAAKRASEDAARIKKALDDAAKKMADDAARDRARIAEEARRYEEELRKALSIHRRRRGWR